MLPAPPSRKLAIVTCMDARLDLFAAFDLDLGEAHILRNAGGLVTDDMLRSLAISQRALGTEQVAIVHHTRCGMDGFDDIGFRLELTSETGAVPNWDVPGFTDLRAQVQRSVDTVRACPWLPHRDAVSGYVYDVATNELQATATT